MNYTGFSLKDHRFIKLLGKGSSEEVYLAEHMYLQTYVAIKMQKARLDVASQQRFLYEAKIVAHLDHPHIIPVLDFTISKGRLSCFSTSEDVPDIFISIFIEHIT